MKTIDEIISQVLMIQHPDGVDQITCDYEEVKEIANRYAKECCKATLEKADANAVVDADYYRGKFTGDYIVDKASITNPENIVLA